MKNLILLICFFPSSILAQTYKLQLYLNNGDIYSVKLDSHPIIYLKQDNIFFKSCHTLTSYPIDDVVKLTVDTIDIPFSIKDVIIDERQISSFTNENKMDSCNITYIRNFVHTEWETLYIPFNIEYENWCHDFEIGIPNNVRQYDDNEDGVFDRIEIEIKKCSYGDIIANSLYFIKAKTPGLKIFRLDQTTLYPTCINSLTCSSIDKKFIFKGNYSTDALPTDGKFEIEEGKIYNVDDTHIVSPFRWILFVENRNQNVYSQETCLSINTISEYSNTSENMDSCIYTPSGIQMSNVRKGNIYIIKNKNGGIRKVIM